MEDKTTDIILFSILLAFFAAVLSTVSSEDDITFEPHTIQKDNMFNKFKRIY